MNNRSAKEIIEEMKRRMANEERSIYEKHVFEMCIDDVLNLIVSNFPNKYVSNLLHGMRVDRINQYLSEYHSY